MQEKIDAFNLLNVINLNRESLFCAKCTNWLSSPIFLKADSLNYCQTCTEQQNDLISTRNDMLEDVLINLHYPCKQTDCDFIGSAEDLRKHMDICMYNILPCFFCDKKVFNETTIFAHFMDVHFGLFTKMLINDPVVEIILKEPLAERNIYILDLRGKMYIVFLEINKETLDFTIGTQAIDTSLRENKFTLVYNHGQNETKIKGKLVNVQKILCNQRSLPKTKIYSPPEIRNANLNHSIKIYFFGFDMVQMSIDECPICFNHLGTEIYQCVNGHNLCSVCIYKVKQCPSCRLEMKSNRISLKHLINDLLTTCPKAHKGCLYIATESEMTHHLKLCEYKSINCIVCNEDHTKQNIAHHMTKKHSDAVYNNFILLCYSFRENQLPNGCAYIKYKNRVFRFTQTMSGFEDAKKVNFTVHLLYDDSKMEADKYRYEVHIRNRQKDFKVVLKVGNVCQSVWDNSVSATINWTFCEKFVIKDENECKFYFRYCIFDVE